jgi:hypothetical protein
VGRTTQHMEGARQRLAKGSRPARRMRPCPPPRGRPSGGSSPWLRLARGGPRLSGDGALLPQQHQEWAAVKMLARGTGSAPVRERGAWVVHPHELSCGSRLADAETVGRVAWVATQRRGAPTPRPPARQGLQSPSRPPPDPRGGAGASAGRRLSIPTLSPAQHADAHPSAILVLIGDELAC